MKNDATSVSSREASARHARQNIYVHLWLYLLTCAHFCSHQRAGCRALNHPQVSIAIALVYRPGSSGAASGYSSNET
eukprot:1157375-Pelagomonas_calceolata.AAC.3